MTAAALWFLSMTSEWWWSGSCPAASAAEGPTFRVSTPAWPATSAGSTRRSRGGTSLRPGVPDNTGPDSTPSIASPFWRETLSNSLEDFRASRKSDSRRKHLLSILRTLALIWIKSSSCERSESEYVDLVEIRKLSIPLSAEEILHHLNRRFSFPLYVIWETLFSDWRKSTKRQNIESQRNIVKQFKLLLWKCVTVKFQYSRCNKVNGLFMYFTNAIGRF